MKKIALLFSVNFLLVACSIWEDKELNYSNMPEIEWSRTYGGDHSDIIEAIQPTLTAGYLLFGSSNSFNHDTTNSVHGSFDYHVIKIDCIGEIEWQETFGGSKDDFLVDAIPGNDGGCILAGDTYSNDKDIKSGIKGLVDFWIVKMSGKGKVIWERTYGTDGEDYLSSIVPTKEGGYLLGGNTSFKGNKNISGLYLINIDFRGKIVWEKNYGGSIINQLTTILPLVDGYLLGGYTELNGGDYCVSKIDNDGNILWERTYGGKYFDTLRSIEKSANGFILFGNSTSFVDQKAMINAKKDIWIVSIDFDGNTIWSKSFGTNDIDDGIIASYSTSDNGYFISGYTGYFNSFLYRLDKNCDIIWENNFSEYFYRITLFQHTLDGQMILAGLPSSENIFLRKDDYEILKIHFPK